METQTPTIEVVSANEAPSFNKILGGSFAWMALGLFVSLVASFVVLLVPQVFYAIVGSSFGFLVCILIEFGIVIYLSRRLSQMSVWTARAAFIAYAFISGLTLSVIFFAFQTDSIITVFLSTALMFGILAFYGAHTKKDLTSWGRIAFFGLIGLVIALVINLFIHSSMFDLILSWIGVIIFTVLIAYDVQRIKDMTGMVTSKEDVAKAKIMGALKLYLDFINLFLDLLRIFGKRR